MYREYLITGKVASIILYRLDEAGSQLNYILCRQIKVSAITLDIYSFLNNQLRHWCFQLKLY